MKKFRSFRNKKKHLSSKYILLILTGVCIVALFTSLVFNLSGGPLNSVAGYVFVPMQKGINNAGSWISGKANDFQTLGEVLKENKKLQNQVDDLTNQLNVTKLEQYELDNYRELLDLDDKYSGYQKVAANVIAMDGTNWFSSFTIDKGSKEGIKKGMNVIAGSGLVGIVTDVGPNFAKVRSIIDDSSNVSSMVLTTKDNFNVGGSLKSMNQDKVLPFTELRDEDDKVKVGDPVVTSYVSDQYQEGILIGYIASIEKNANNLTKSGTITPVVDFQHLREVLVITTLKTPEKRNCLPEGIRYSGRNTGQYRNTKITGVGKRRKIVLFIIIAICFLLQTTVFRALTFANIGPNLLIIVVSSFGLMRGKKEGLWVGFFCGLLIDIFFGFYLGGYALLYMYIGYINGLFKKRFYPDDIKLPMILIGSSDIVNNLIIYIVMFFMRSRFSFWYYFTSIILPEFVYTMVITIFLYFILLKINQKLEEHEKRRAIKFEL